MCRDSAVGSPGPPVTGTSTGGSPSCELALTVSATCSLVDVLGLSSGVVTSGTVVGMVTSTRWLEVLQVPLPVNSSPKHESL